MPKTGIALAAFDPDLQFFNEQLVSIQHQNFKDWICVIQFDSEMYPIQHDPLFASITKDARFIWKQNAYRLGHTENFASAAQECLKLFPELESIAFSDQDDIWYLGKLEELRQALKNTPPGSGVHSNMDLLFPDGRKVPGFEYEARKVENFNTYDLVLRNICTGASALFDANLFRKYPEVPAEFKDYDHWYAVCAHLQGKLIALPQVLYTYRQHAQNVIGAQKSAGLVALRKKRKLPDFIEHCSQLNSGFKNRVSTLPLSQTEKNDLKSFPTLIGSLFRTLSQGNIMVSRLCLARLIATFIKRT